MGQMCMMTWSASISKTMHFSCTDKHRQCSDASTKNAHVTKYLCVWQIPQSGFLTSGVYALFTSKSGMVDKSHYEHPASRHQAYKAMSEEVFTTSGLKLQSAYAAGNEGQEPPLTTQTDYFMGCLDYIWLSRKHWHVTHTLSMPYDVSNGPEPQNVGFRPIPDAEFPSDHLAVGCRVALHP